MCLCLGRRGATVEALTELTVLCLGRAQFTELLGPLQDIMQRDKSPQVPAGHHLVVVQGWQTYPAANGSHMNGLSHSNMGEARTCYSVM